MKNNILKIIFLLFCVGITAQTISTNAIKRISNYLSESEKNGLTGGVLIANGDAILLNKGFGFANKSKKVKNTPKTVFDIGSVSKQFTAAAILKLEEQGKLKVEDKLSKYFKGLPEDKKNITLHQLLIHSSGLTRGIGRKDFDQIDRDDFFKQFFKTTLLQRPGLKHVYSNAGYSVLARVIELVSGETYETYLRKEIFLPAGMKYTGYILPYWKDLTIAKGYSYNVLNIGSMIERYQRDGAVSWVIMGNGGLNSTHEDMFLWYQALRDGTVLSKEAVKKMITPYIIERKEDNSYYAYGWVIFKTARGTNMVAHDGSNATFFYDFRWMPKEDVVVLYATSSMTREVGPLAWRIDKMLFDDTYIPKEVKTDLVTTMLEYSENYKGSLIGLQKELKSKFGSQLNKPFYLNRLSGIYSRNGMLLKAIMVAELNIKMFPKDSNIWDSLGQAYYDNNQVKKGLSAFKIAYKLDSKNLFAKDMISKIVEEINKN
jgi:CubicO group peptidase (beta-lactamase class C family)